LCYSGEEVRTSIYAPVTEVKTRGRANPRAVLELLALPHYLKRKQTMLREASNPTKVQPTSGPTAENMQQLGLMASGIAHDFNNLLTNIMGHMSLALLKTSFDDDSRPHIERAVKTAEYAAALTTQLLNYSRKQSLTQTREYIDLNEIVNDVVGLVETILLTNSQVDLNLDPALPLIKASQTHIQQIIMNLLINAAEAIDDPTNGKISIQSGKCHTSSLLNSCWCSDVQDMLLGDYVFLQINDNGRGMDEGTLDMIFDPFFSTKPKGRGLGLSTILDIVREYQGYISVKSTLGEGTIFRIFFPYRFDNFSPVH
jgi:two-component system cell cycle sensor histidine kinase/response regulator CckA